MGLYHPGPPTDPPLAVSQTHQFDEAVLQLGQLVLERAVLGEGPANGGLVRLHVLQHAPPVLRLLALALLLALQLPQPRLLLRTQPTQLPVIPQLGRGGQG